MPNTKGSLVSTEVLSFEYANLSLYQSITIKDGINASNPYPDLGNSVNLEHINFDTLNIDAFNAIPLRPLGVISNNATLEYKTLTVLPALQEDYAQRATRGNRTQYRTAFQSPSDFDSKVDIAGFALPSETTNPSFLQIRYYVP
jgi:hypothetical protein